MKILHVSTLDWGGAANAGIRLHMGLLKQGVDSKLLVMRQQNPEIPQSFEFYTDTYGSGLKAKTIDVMERAHNKRNQLKLKNRKTNFQPFNFSRQFCDITNNQHYQEADIINFHWVARFLDYSSFFRKNKKPIVWTLHDMEPFGGGNHYEKEFLFDSYKDLIEDQLKLKKRAVSNQNINVVGPSRWLMNCSKNSEVLGKFPHYNIPYGLDVDIFKKYDPAEAKAAFGIPADKKAILFVSEVITNRRKGFHLLLEALEILKRDDFYLCAVGKVEEGHALHDIPNFHHLGVIKDQRKMAMAYAASDVFVIPSIEDNLPNTVLESICTGTPVIGYDIGGVPDMIQHEQNGLICNDVSGACLADAMDEFLSLGDKFDRDWIIEDAHNRYHEDLQAKRYHELYESVLSVRE